MTTGGQCVVCTRDNPDGYVCGDCIAQLAADLRTLAWLGAELMVTRTRQARLASAGGPVVSEGSPLGYHIGAAYAYDALHNMLVTRVRSQHDGREPWPADTPASMVRWLVDRLDRVRRDPGADYLATEVKHHTERALETINPLDPNEQTYGICGAERRDDTTCTAYLYGAPKADWVRCRRCKTQHDTWRRIRALEQRMRTLYFRAATLARLLPRLIERPVSASNIRNWAREGRPIRTGEDSEGVITYHCGDVITVACATPTRTRTDRSTG